MIGDLDVYHFVLMLIFDKIEYITLMLFLGY